MAWSWSTPPSSARSRPSSTRTSSWRSWSSPTTIASTAATSRCTRRLITLLATQSPVATDLRLISSLLHVLKCVERMGDQCVNICKMIPLSGNEPPADEKMVELILSMGRQTRTLIGQAKRSFEGRDVEMARDLVRQDDVVDDLNRDCFRLALEIGDDADRREWAMTMLLAARAIERIGDNAVDIGEQVAFVVTGLFREFEDASHPSA